ncbi:MAG: hypothetical protein KF803_17265 [Cyclobacteriaceae bacterium]|nr:hypothetical protein [Cyclobacteriaceae bacterium]
MNKIIIISGLLLMLGCSSDSITSFENQLSGHYKIVSINSTPDADLNNDELKSENLFEEISGLHNTIDGKSITFYDFNSPENYMEIRPLKNSTNNAKLISINFPDQLIGEQTTEVFYLVQYKNTFTNYSYTTSQNSQQIVLTNNNPEYVENGEINSLEYQPNVELVLKLSKKLFDFTDHDWINVNITATYKKVE